MGTTTSIENHPVVSREQWLAERQKLLTREKELTREKNEVARERRALPWVRVEKNYVFDTPEGRRTLAELFQHRRQLLVQHFMFGPGWEQGCPSCSYMADHTDGMTVTSPTAISLSWRSHARRSMTSSASGTAWAGGSAGYPRSAATSTTISASPSSRTRRERRGALQLRPWAGAFEELPGISVFYKDDAGEVFHTYSTYGRGVES